jgi:hypothetical protein
MFINFFLEEVFQAILSTSINMMSEFVYIPLFLKQYEEVFLSSMEVEWEMSGLKNCWQYLMCILMSCYFERDAIHMLGTGEERECLFFFQEKRGNCNKA